MAKGTGSISLLIDSPLRDLANSLRVVGPDIRTQINSATKSAAEPIWTQETQGRAVTKLQNNLLANSARVGVTSRNVLLRSGGLRFKGKSGDSMTGATEFGGGANKLITTKSRGGKVYKRRLGSVFGPRYRNGAVVYPAASDSIPRFASLWVQTARRTIHEAIEKVN
nr:hypothetical protein [Microbacterium lemovicicum]